MQILSVALQNFKTHRDKYVVFQPGINAISGENGAGKTSLLEAIAWVLFNYQGDYAKEDLIRNGSGSAQVTVRFTSNHDGRTYEVQRCTQRGYTLFDPQLNERLPYNRIKDEVLPWLKQHIGVASTTNLPQLFARTVGVPQGTFTADFLQSAEQRRAVFDAILKVEDYKVAYKHMNSLRRYAEDQVEAIKAQINQYDESLADWDALNQRQQALQQEIQASKQQLEQRQQTLAELTQQREHYTRQRQQIQGLKEQQQSLSQNVHHSQALLVRLEQSLEQAHQAQALCDQHQEAYGQFQAVEQDLQGLSAQQQQRQRLQDQYRTLQEARSQQQNKLAQLRAQLDGLQKTEQDLAALQPQIDQQVRLEGQVADLQNQINHFGQLQLEQQSLEQQLQQLQLQVTTLDQTSQRLQDLAQAVEEITPLETHRDRIQQQISRLDAARQFEAELRQLASRATERHQHQQAILPPLLQEMAAVVADLPRGEHWLATLQTALADNENLVTYLLTGLEDILQDLAHQTDESDLKAQLRDLQKQLTQRYRWQGELTQLDALKEQMQANREQQTQLERRLQSLSTALAQQPTLTAELDALQQQIKDLGYPREKSEILQRTLSGKASLETNYNQLLASQGSQDQDLARLTAALDQFQGLDQRVADLQQQRATYQTGYNLFLQHQNLAASHSRIKQEWESTQASRQDLQQRLQSVETGLGKAEADFDAEAAAALETQYQTLKSEADQILGRLPEMQRRLGDLAQQIQSMEAIAEKRKLAQNDLKTKEKAKRFIKFARRVYKEAGPRITEQYARVVSAQADKLFRELLGRPNVALEWTRDYEILVQEGAHQRRFVNLSGGEQMCAALAVRLALLKVLADIDIAFFDAPPTNMDRTRRDGLAEAIGRIRAFQQLFVISHDDTFEKVTENVIFLARE